ncbi:hypothetical protein LAZ67_18001195 [Cordylochernes scorpioides]|uniref:Uncharacterized protein n=1 Tax=Cordylochernes scorpioides TaxID=51811 RepID=A0ABY6LGG8_9ARAC|nr:hypothetical protein LAZ67_18001195 [Cordylochernes scorpioides]
MIVVTAKDGSALAYLEYGFRCSKWAGRSQRPVPQTDPQSSVKWTEEAVCFVVWEWKIPLLAQPWPDLCQGPLLVK